MRRIASLLPAGTEIAGRLGLTDRLVGVTFECDDPPGIRDRVPVVVDTALAADATPAEIDAIVRKRATAGPAMYELDRATLAAADPDPILTVRSAPCPGRRSPRRRRRSVPGAELAL
ncbi:hypothetical protein [Pseudonocardia parietis]|uniref:Fe/B12 periplasmic-binding domain-containing protein n=1 Tax=Pseudonocardia parietis TaxID=570936 RepID=A0ABS4VY98_9PSEU|nr:hypothetical protein [Pseudonocardia parietis]MBP2368905.1 hypothetical protein [Pseudonocardia parietis]